MGHFDQFLRLALVSIILAFLVSGKFVGGMAFLMGITGFAMVVTSLSLTCPIYRLLGIRTTFNR